MTAHCNYFRKYIHVEITLVRSLISVHNNSVLEKYHNFRNFLVVASKDKDVKSKTFHFEFFCIILRKCILLSSRFLS
jgi:hypothetical protein